MGFVGVSTTGSSIRTVFPRWAGELGLPARTLVGHDLPLTASAADHRRVIETIRDDPDHVGALITTHKVAVFDAAADLFDELDPVAEVFGEISLLTKHEGRVVGSAKDPMTAALALTDLVGDRYFQARTSQALVLGTGGAGLAISHVLASRSDRPALICCTDVSPDRLREARRLHQRAGMPTELFRYVHTPDPAAADAMVSGLPPGSLVVNATGLGKDRPGSPLSGDAVFPDHATVWDLNYRGSLDFLAQARLQDPRRELRIEDGWRYFIHGWTQAIADVFAIPMPPDRVEVLSGIAAQLRR